MKYPPVCSAHWEGAVGQWLRGQLDARGIDALAYGRYVLSLLTRPLDPADLSPSPIGNKNWERRNQSDWPPVKIEALKRSAAVQCLINASDDQNSGIEELVDELCIKLKEVEESNIQSGKRDLQTTKSSRKERLRPHSPREMARLYYAAFPALVPSNSTSETVQPSSIDAVVAPCPITQKSRNILSHKHTSSGKDCSRSKKSQVCKERPSVIRSHNHAGHRQRRSRKSYPHAEDLPEWVNNGDVWDMESQEHVQDLIKGIDEGYGTCDNTIVDEVPSTKRLYERDADYFNVDGDEIMFMKNWAIEDGFKSLQKSPSEEESMAKFKAKFDRSLEALWPKEQNNNIEYELPLDFHDVPSPSDRMFDCYSADKPLPLSLTSSIWSNNDSKSDWETNESVAVNLHPQSAAIEAAQMNLIPAKQTNVWQNDDSYNKETMEVIYNKLKPLNLDDSTAESSHEINASSHAPKWVEDSAKEPCLFSFKLHQPPIGTPARSLNILNHDSVHSSFMEVVPKAPSGFVGDSFVRKNNSLKLDLSKTFCNIVDDGEKEEEDLLTSMRTHFRPIKHDATDCPQTVVNYADGMTFPIVSDMDTVKFSRSDSGTIFLETENEPPKQYMEYRKQGIDYARLDICSSSICSDDGLSSKDLILKFRVCQTEKSVQTEDADADRSPLPNSYLPQEFSLRPVSDNSNKVGGLDPDKELESLDFNWVQCDECKLNNNQWLTDDWSSCNSSKIWSSDDAVCKTCTEQQAKTKMKYCTSRKDKIYEEETAREWDELLSDLRYIHDFKSDGNWTDELNTPSENCYIAPTEISIRAADGNFIQSALLAKRNDMENVKSWLGKVESNVVGKILDHSLIMYGNVEPHCEACVDDSANPSALGWRVDRKRRHSAVSGGRAKGAGKLRCTLPGQDAVYVSRPMHMPLLPATDRPLTR
ncbi:uncharacterized protein LOC143917849 isoform X2 [Arctopsyche grandis]|uniref:uncharacterized protein LOC143917849 isoform X2 n=1 Tax=Arctopsyche grandis TaxID=121162 RepID=UPI00406D7374